MIPPIYQPAAVRYISRSCPITGDIAMGLDLPDGTVARYRLTPKDVELLQQSFSLYAGPYACQSSNSSDIPSAVGSPHDGQNVSPLDISSAASAGCAYEPKSSSSNMACQRPFLASFIQNTPARVEWLKAVTFLMVLALSLGGWWYSHSRKVPSTASPEQGQAVVAAEVRHAT